MSNITDVRVYPNQKGSAVIAHDVRPSENIKEESRLRRKVDLIIRKFGPELLSTSVDELRSMAQEEYVADNHSNVFCRMWDEFRFIPSGRWVRKLGDPDLVDLLAVAAVMEAVWGD